MPPHPTPGYRALRAGRVSERGRPYLVTTVTHDRAPHFRDHDAALAMSRFVSAPDGWPDATLHAWVLMPDHLHAVLSLAGESPLSTVVSRFKGRAAHAFNRWRGAAGPVWMAGFHDRAVREWEALRAVARYVVENPVRAGLVARIGDYPFWDCEWISEEGVGV